jgi:O-antigen/teichoic acid export membrane protein
MVTTVAANESKTLLKNILTGSLIFYGLSGLTSLLNYAYYPAIARQVGTSTYGEIQFLTSVFMQFAVGFVVLNILSIIITAKYPLPDNRKKALQALNTVSITFILTVVVVGSVFLMLGRKTFGFTSALPLLLLGVSLLINVPFTILIGKLQGEGKFIRSGVVSALSGFFKLGFALLFVVLGWGSAGAIAGIATGMLAATIVGHMIDGKRPAKPAKRTRMVNLGSVIRLYGKQLTHFKTERTLLVASLVAMGFLTVLSTADVLVSKVFLSPHDAGLYAGVATISKVILYATTPLMWLALPVALANLPHTRSKVRYYVILTGVLGVTLLGVFTVFQSTIVQGLLGIDAGSYTSLLPLASVAMTLFALVLITTAVNLCQDRLRVAIATSLAAIFGFTIFFLAFQNTGEVKAGIIGQIAAACVAIIISTIGNKFYGKKA